MLKRKENIKNERKREFFDFQKILNSSTNFEKNKEKSKKYTLFKNNKRENKKRISQSYYKAVDITEKFFLELEKDYINLNSKKSLNNGICNCQIVRSAGKWSLGLRPNYYEESIHIAYIQLITEAKHFIYIENQFFISSLAGKKVSNIIGEAILNRIKKAALNKEKFRVIILMPLLPVFYIKNFKFAYLFNLSILC